MAGWQPDTPVRLMAGAERRLALLQDFLIRT